MAGLCVWIVFVIFVNHSSAWRHWEAEVRFCSFFCEKLQVRTHIHSVVAVEDS